jgi:hypothetical protein
MVESYRARKADNIVTTPADAHKGRALALVAFPVIGKDALGVLAAVSLEKIGELTGKGTGSRRAWGRTRGCRGTRNLRGSALRSATERSRRLTLVQQVPTGVLASGALLLLLLLLLLLAEGEVEERQSEGEEGSEKHDAVQHGLRVAGWPVARVDVKSGGVKEAK